MTYSTVTQCTSEGRKSQNLRGIEGVGINEVLTVGSPPALTPVGVLFIK